MFDHSNVINVKKRLHNVVVLNLINEKFMDLTILMDTKVVGINYMCAKIVDIHQQIQRIIMNISKIFIHIRHFFIDIMIKDNLNSNPIRYYQIKVYQIDRHYPMKIFIFNDIILACI